MQTSRVVNIQSIPKKVFQAVVVAVLLVMVWGGLGHAAGSSPANNMLLIGHASGKCGKPCLSTDKWASYLARYTKNDNLDLLTTTESVQHGLAGKLKKDLGSGFTVRQVPASSSQPDKNAHEYLFISRDSAMKPSSSSPRARQLSSVVGGSNVWRNPFAAEQSYSVAGSDHTLHAFVLHAPSAVESGNNYGSNTVLDTASRQGFQNMGGWVTSLDTGTSIDLVNMDSNVDWKRPAWRKRVLGYMSQPGAKATSTWDSQQPTIGTHAGGRLIDVGVVYHTSVSSASVRTDNNDPSDHKAIMYMLAFPGASHQGVSPGGTGNAATPSQPAYSPCDASDSHFSPDPASCCVTDSSIKSNPDVCKNVACTDATNCSLVQKYLNPIINKFLAPLAILAVVIGLVWGGIQYSVAGGDATKVAAAKAEIGSALLGLVAFILLYALLDWLIPGGLV